MGLADDLKHKGKELLGTAEEKAKALMAAAEKAKELKHAVEKKGSEKTEPEEK